MTSIIYVQCVDLGEVVVRHGLPVDGEEGRGGEGGGGDAQPLQAEHRPQLSQLPLCQHRVETVLQLVILRTHVAMCYVFRILMVP